MMDTNSFFHSPLGWPDDFPEKLVSKQTYNDLQKLAVQNSKGIDFCVDEANGANIQFELINPSGELIQDFSHSGVIFQNLNEMDLSHTKEIIRKSCGLIHRVPCLFSTIDQFARNIGLLRADAGMDVSFSDPRFIGTVFLSLPERNEMNAVERFTEALIHESLHNQLTALENLCPLFEENKMRNDVFSPWKGEGRDERGLLHAVYVFSNLHEFWRGIADKEQVSRRFADKRCHFIFQQLSESKHLLGYDSLNDSGKLLAELCLRKFL